MATVGDVSIVEVADLARSRETALSGAEGTVA